MRHHNYENDQIDEHNSEEEFVPNGPPIFLLVLLTILPFVILAFTFTFVKKDQAALLFASVQSWFAPSVAEARLLPPEGLTKEQVWVLVQIASKEYDVSPEFIWAVITVESAFDPLATSHAGAMGLMQLMPGTARELKVANPYNPYDNIAGGTRYLRKLLDRFRGKRELALAAYNAGPTAVRRHKGIPPYRETRRYVKRVMKIYKEKVALRRNLFKYNRS